MDELRLGSSVSRFNVLLREHRERLLLSQEELAARSGLSTRAIRYLENGGVRRPRLGSVRLLADALRLSGPTRAEFELAASRGTEPKPATSSAKGEESTAPPALLPLTVPTFVGRDAEIASLVLLLAADGDAAPVVVSVSGPPGWARPPWRSTGPIGSERRSRTGSCTSICAALLPRGRRCGQARRFGRS